MSELKSNPFPKPSNPFPKPSLTPEQWEAERAAREAEYRRESAEWQRQSRHKRLVDSLGPRFTPELSTMESYETYHDSQRPIVERVKELCADGAALVRSRRNIIFWGTPGTGKDRMLSAILYAVVKDFPTHWINGFEIYDKEKLFELLRNQNLGNDPQVLAVSDVIDPHAELSPWESRMLFKLVETRYRAQQPLWVTVNAASREDLVSRIPPTIFGRLKQNAIMLPCFWPDYRTK